MNISSDTLVEQFAQRLSLGQAALFVGAGLSTASGFVDWKGLLAHPSRSLGLSVDAVPDLTELAEYCAQGLGRNILVQHVVDNLTRACELTENHRILARLPVREIWTTNYDLLLERAFEEAGMRCDVRRRDTDFMAGDANAKVYIYKLHGDVTARDEIVITRSDYERYLNTHYLLETSFFKAAADTTLLFLGVGFSDPNFRRIMASLEVRFSTSVRTHYAIMLRPHESDQVRFKFFIDSLAKYGIRTAVVDSVKEVTDMLRRIASKCERTAPDEILIGQDKRNGLLVEHLERLANHLGEPPKSIRVSAVFSAFAISNDEEYSREEPTNSQAHMLDLMRERQALEKLVVQRAVPLKLLLCPPIRYRSEHEIRYRNILNWLRTNSRCANINVRCASLDFFTNMVILTDHFCIAANYNPRLGYDENRVYWAKNRIERYAESFDESFNSADLARNTVETVRYYEKLLEVNETKKPQPWVSIDTSVKYSWLSFSVEEGEVDVPNQGRKTYTFVRHPGSVLVLAMQPSGKLLTVEQYRFLVGAPSIEFPAGRLAPGEGKQDCAKRELQEETGYTATQWQQLGEFYTTNGITNELMTVFLAQGLVQETCHSSPIDDIEEVTTVKEFSVEEIRALTREGRIKDGPTIAALQYLTDHRLAR